MAAWIRARWIVNASQIYRSRAFRQNQAWTQADQEQAARLLLAGAALRHSGLGGLTSGGAIERYLLRPLFQEREEWLRRLAGLEVERSESVEATSTDSLLAQTMKNPEFQRR